MNYEVLSIETAKKLESAKRIIDELEKYIQIEAKIELYGDRTGLRTFADVNDILNKLNELKEKYGWK
ncbi:MAG: hypothetical protein IKE89_03570 [Bacilli bacterium]|nr:hypothetical protein [Bacilli bacterium]MBR2711531.1 hypothetical protein [Bacilli bacterium]